MTENFDNISQIKFSYHPKFKMNERPKISGSQDAREILFQQFDQDTFALHESFKVLYLSRSNRVLGVEHHSIGSTAGCLVDKSRILAGAILANASGIILCHNHPSGNPKPSQADIKLTRDIKEACTIIDKSLLDHIILTEDGYTSFADEALL